LFISCNLPDGKWNISAFHVKDTQKPEFTNQICLDVLNPEATDFFKFNSEELQKNVCIKNSMMEKKVKR